MPSLDTSAKDSASASSIAYVTGPEVGRPQITVSLGAHVVGDVGEVVVEHQHVLHVTHQTSEFGAELVRTVIGVHGQRQRVRLHRALQRRVVLGER